MKRWLCFLKRFRLARTFDMDMSWYHVTPEVLNKKALVGTEQILTRKHETNFKSASCSALTFLRTVVISSSRMKTSSWSA